MDEKEKQERLLRMMEEEQKTLQPRETGENIGATLASSAAKEEAKGNIAMNKLSECKACGGKVSNRASKCPHCGEPKHKTAGEAFFTWGGFGILDLLPFTRDMSSGAKFVLMLVILIPLIIVVLGGR